MSQKYRLPNIVITNELEDSRFDTVLIVGEWGTHIHLNDRVKFCNALQSLIKIDASKDVKIIYSENSTIKRIVYAPTGSLDGDYDDVRNFQEAAKASVKKALAAGSKSPIVILPSHNRFRCAEKATLLAIFHALYIPIEHREHLKCNEVYDVQKLGVYHTKDNFDNIEAIVGEVKALETGRFVARDIGGSDPERMSAPKVVHYVQEIFKDTCISLDVIDNQHVFEREYPLLAAVNRCAAGIPRHAGHLIKLEYIGEGEIYKTLMLVGKGITYDSGGANVKINGSMAGMHRDKCGAAAVAGFFKMLSIIKPKNLKVVGSMSMVRNSIGSDCYVADEVLLSRAGVRVRVRNTDAEGRMVMADVLCEMREKALKEVNPLIFTIATLTGHVSRCYGDNYFSCLDNGPARKKKVSELIASAGEDIGDACEVTRLRKEDFQFVAPLTRCEDVLQGNYLPSTGSNRGHMIPAAFLTVASGLDKHGCDSDHPIPYTHMDVAGSAGSFPDLPTGSPLMALAEAFVFKQ